MQQGQLGHVPAVGQWLGSWEGVGAGASIPLRWLLLLLLRHCEPASLPGWRPAGQPGPQCPQQQREVLLSSSQSLLLGVQWVHLVPTLSVLQVLSPTLLGCLLGSWLSSGGLGLC